jgi:hypothetical protein
MARRMRCADAGYVYHLLIRGKRGQVRFFLTGTQEKKGVRLGREKGTSGRSSFVLGKTRKTTKQNGEWFERHAAFTILNIHPEPPMPRLLFCSYHLLLGSIQRSSFVHPRAVGVIGPARLVMPGLVRAASRLRGSAFPTPDPCNTANPFRATPDGGWDPHRCPCSTFNTAVCPCRFMR